MTREAAGRIDHIQLRSISATPMMIKAHKATTAAIPKSAPKIISATFAMLLARSECFRTELNARPPAVNTRDFDI